jgi:hypothetical protein
LEALEEPASLIALRNEIKARMPRVDLPEILLEVAARTSCMDAFTHLTERTARAADLTTSLCAVLMAEACNTGPEPLVRQDTPALKRDRLMWVDQNYVRDDTLIACNAVLVAEQNRIALARAWGGGDVASADGMRFVVPVRTIHAAPNPKYFNRGRGVTWYNLLSDQCTGLNAITVPGTLRDSLVLLAVVLEQQTELQPTQIMTDTGAYSDVVFGLFRLSGYRFCPRLADVGGTRFCAWTPKPTMATSIHWHGSARTSTASRRIGMTYCAWLARSNSAWCQQWASCAPCRSMSGPPAWRRPSPKSAASIRPSIR